MERVQGVVGIFFKARNPKRLAAWYQTHLGLELIFETKQDGPAQGPASMNPPPPVDPPPTEMVSPHDATQLP